MGTRAAIGLLNKDGSVRSATVAYDGMPDTAGETLNQHYNSEALIKALFKKGGNIRTLGAKPNLCSFYRDDSEWDWATDHADRKAWADEHHWCDYGYLFDPAKGKWEIVST